MNDTIERAISYESHSRTISKFSQELSLISELRIELAATRKELSDVEGWPDNATKEREKQKEVIDSAMIMIAQSCPPECKGDLMRWNQLEDSLSKLESENE